VAAVLSRRQRGVASSICARRGERLIGNSAADTAAATTLISVSSLSALARQMAAQLREPPSVAARSSVVARLAHLTVQLSIRLTTERSF